MNEFFEICRKNKINEIDTIIKEGFPAYIYLNNIFEIIFEYDYTELYVYMMCYIETHFLRDILNSTYKNYIDQYRFFLLMKDDKTPISYSELETIFEHFAFFNPFIVINLMKLNLSQERILFLHDNFYLNKRYLINGEYCKYRILISFIDFTNASKTRLWNIVDKTEISLKNTILDKLISIFPDYVLNSMLSSKAVDLYNHTVSRFNIPTTTSHYVNSCCIGDYDLSMNLLNKICPGTGDILSTRKRLNRLKSCSNLSLIARALENSWLSKNEKLIEFNRQLFKKLYNREPYEFYYSQMIENVDDAITRKNNYKIRSIFIRDIYDYIYHSPKEIDELFETQIKILNFTDGKLQVSKEHRIDNYFYICSFHLCSIGLRDKIHTTILEIDDEKFRDGSLKIIKYYETLNHDVSDRINSSGILNKNVLGLVYHYAKY